MHTQIHPTLIIMKYLVAISILFAASTAIAVDIDPRISHIADRLSSTDVYTDSARFSMTMEAMSTDVGYDVHLAQRRAEGDTLAPCSYIIRWSDSENGRSGGFAAYYHGNLFRFSGRKLTEFHAAEDTTVFRPSNPSAGMQQTAQYAYLLPAFIGAELRKMAADPAYTLSFNPDTIIGGRHLQSVKAVSTHNGLAARTINYITDRATSLPVFLEIVNNPGAPSEQIISVAYSGCPAHDCGEINEQTLAAMFPEPFTRFRSFRMNVSNLSGLPLPGFSLPTTTGERYTRAEDDAFRRPTILAIIDETATDRAAVESLRNAVASLKPGADLILAFTGNDVDRIEALAPDMRQGEHLLMSARGLARDLGARQLPTVIVCDSAGMVTKVLPGHNNQLASDVIEYIDSISDNS